VIRKVFLSLMLVNLAAFSQTKTTPERAASLKADLVGQIDGIKKQAQVMVDTVFSRRNFLNTGLATATWAFTPPFGETPGLTALMRILSPGRLDPARGIEAITVNRWPHGNAYEYNYLWDPEWKKGESPCEIGRKQFRQVPIANSDAAAAAYTDQAIDQACRAVQEQ
jgi:hypothetical protein